MLGKNLPAFSKSPMSKQGSSVFELHRSHLELIGLSCEYVPVLPFPESVWRLLSHLGPGQRDSSLYSQEAGKETRGRAEKPAGADGGGWARGQAARGREVGGWAEGRQLGAAGFVAGQLLSLGSHTRAQDGGSCKATDTELHQGLLWGLICIRG